MNLNKDPRFSMDTKMFRHELQIGVLSVENAYLNLTSERPNPILAKSIYEDGIKKLKYLLSLIDQNILEQTQKLMEKI